MPVTKRFHTKHDEAAERSFSDSSWVLGLCHEGKLDYEVRNATAYPENGGHNIGVWQNGQFMGYVPSDVSLKIMKCDDQFTPMIIFNTVCTLISCEVSTCTNVSTSLAWMSNSATRLFPMAVDGPRNAYNKLYSARRRGCFFPTLQFV